MLTLFGQIRSGLLNLLTFPSPPKSRTLFKALRWPDLLALQTPFYGPTTRACVPSNLHLNSFLTAIGSLGTKPFGIGYGVSSCPKKIQIFLWKAMWDRLPTKTYLAFGRSNMDIRCPRCHSPETTIHILWDCP